MQQIVQRIKNNIQRLLTLFILMSLACINVIQADDFLDRHPYIYVVDEDSKIEAVSDSLFYDRSRGVIFVVNKWDLRKNDPWLTELRNEVVPWANEHDYNLLYIEMRGAASPEGPTDNNRMLAFNRVRVIQEQLDTMFVSLNRDRLGGNTERVTEDYKGLVFMMHEANDPDTQVVEEIVDRYYDDIVPLKKELRKIDDGKLWNRLLHTYYPRLRATRILLYFGKPQVLSLPITPEAQIEALPQQAEMACLGVTEDLTLDLAERHPRQHMLALRTNVLYDGFYMPRYGWAPTPDVHLEYYPRRGHYTYNAGITISDWEHWKTYEFWQIQDLNFEVRRYLTHIRRAPADAGKDRDVIADYYMGPYVGLNLDVNRYGIGLDDNTGWEGEGFGGGINFGYVMPLCKSYRWRLEFSLGLGMYISKYDPYVYRNPLTGEDDGLYYYDWTLSADLFRKRNYRLTWFGPTNFGIHLTYDILYRNRNKRTPTFRRWENK